MVFSLLRTVGAWPGLNLHTDLFILLHGLLSIAPKRLCLVRALHGKLLTRHFLKELGVIDDDVCVLCKTSISNAHIHLTCGNYVNSSWVLALQCELFMMKQLWSITSSNTSVIYQLWLNLFSLELHGTYGGRYSRICWGESKHKIHFFKEIYEDTQILMQWCTWKLAKGSTLNSTLSNWGITLVQWDLSYWNLPTSEGFRGNIISFSSDPAYQPWVTVYQSSTSSDNSGRYLLMCISPVSAQNLLGSTFSRAASLVQVSVLYQLRLVMWVLI